MPTLEDAIILAINAHRGQVDKAGAPYILHPLHLMMQMHSETAKIVAVLHDVVEDTPYTLDDLVAQGYPTDMFSVPLTISGHSWVGFVRNLFGNHRERWSFSPVLSTKDKCLSRF